MRGSRASLRALCFAAAIAPFAIWAATPAQADETFTRLTTIQIPGAPLTSFDISWVDVAREQYMLADRSNKSLDVISTDSNTVQFQVTGFVGFTGNNDTSGPDGVLTVHHTQAWVGDGNSTVKVVDLASRSIVDSIATGGTKRADELCFDRRDNRIMIANDADNPPFVTFISTTAGHQVLGHIPFANATNGLEQCQWWYKTGLIYFAVPEINGNVGHGEIAVIDPRSMTIANTFPMDCEPAGLTIGPDGQALVGCNDASGIRVIDLRNGNVVKVFNLNGADQVWFNPGDDHYFAALSNNAGGPVLAAIDADPPVLDQTIPSGTGDHSVAADPETNHVFFPLRPIPTDAACQHGCIGVYAAPNDDHGEHRQEASEHHH